VNHQTTTIAILGVNTVVENALAQLLEGEGYSTKVIKTSPLREALVEEEMPLEGVDLVVLAPSLSTSQCDAFLTARRTTHQRVPTSSSPIPVIMLCTPMSKAPALLQTEEEEAARSVTWPTTAGHLVREIEGVLLEARFPAHRERYRRRKREGGLHR
jgi:hypothetical protein